jgi:hypothetical protein
VYLGENEERQKHGRGVGPIHGRSLAHVDYEGADYQERLGPFGEDLNELETPEVEPCARLSLAVAKEKKKGDG